MRVCVVRVLLIVVVVAASSSAQAEDGQCSVERLARIRGTLAEARRLTRLWSYGWASSYAAFVAGSVTLSQTIPEHDQRVDFYFSAGSSAVGVAAALIGPLQELRAMTRLEERLAARPDAGTCAQLADAERVLAEVARRERWGQGWFAHLGHLVFSAGVGVGLGAGFGRWRSAFIQSAVGGFIGEVMVLTRPMGAVRLHERLELRPFGTGLAAVIHF